jgi:hypothetical protein
MLDDAHNHGPITGVPMQLEVQQMFVEKRWSVEVAVHWCQVSGVAERR